MRLNAPPMYVARAFCRLYPMYKPRWVLKMLQEAKLQVLKARLCMCETHLKGKNAMADLLESVKSIALWGQSSSETLLIAGPVLPDFCEAAISFLSHEYKNHIVECDDGEEAGHVGCATHCARYCLSVGANGHPLQQQSDGVFSTACNHEHAMTCAKCNLPFQLLSECRRHISVYSDSTNDAVSSYQKVLQDCVRTGKTLVPDMSSCAHGMQDAKAEAAALSSAMDTAEAAMKAFMMHEVRVFQQNLAKDRGLADAAPGAITFTGDHMAKWTAQVYEYALSFLTGRCAFVGNIHVHSSGMHLHTCH